MAISERLVEWYRGHRRELPWRKTNEPYRIWLSEVILQQTRVEQGLRYYEAFLERFPDVRDLADASEEEVLRMWQGLGYYTRARNLHRTARYIAYERDGEFPREFEELRGLRGVGPYTAAAIASFSFGKRTPVVDGNVERVIARLYEIEEAVNAQKGKKKVNELADITMGEADPAEFNQAIMEFGAVQCVPKNPDCPNCPLKVQCRAYQSGSVERLPVKKKGRKARQRYFNYLYLRNEEGPVLEQRRERDIWQNLFQLPLIETKSPVGEKELREGALPSPPFYDRNARLELVAEERHTLSHQRIHARFWKAALPEAEWPESWFQVSDEALDEYAFPRLIEIFLG